jgi:hypothetical protein
VLPQAENCSDSLDNDCDGLTDSADTEDCGGGEDGGSKPDADADAGADGEDAGGTDTGGDPVVTGTCNCGTTSHPEPILLLTAILIFWRRKIRHAD